MSHFHNVISTLGARFSLEDDYSVRIHIIGYVELLVDYVGVHRKLVFKEKHGFITASPNILLLINILLHSAFGAALFLPAWKQGPILYIATVLFLLSLCYQMYIFLRIRFLQYRIRSQLFGNPGSYR